VSSRRQFKTELADLSFKYLCPAEHEEIDSFINSKLKSYENLLADATSELAERLSQDAWFQERIQQVAVTGRTKSRHSTWKKLLRDGCATEQVNDLVALRVVIHPSSEHEDEHAHDDLCYHALGKIHGLWTPLPRTLKDYISSPKPNGYRSLHTTVLVGTQPLEIQIRTASMHQVAEYGAAAHWSYKDPASLPWLQIVRQWQLQVDSAHEFIQLVRRELLGTRVFVFTRNGRILNLSRGATVADAAEEKGVSLRGHTPLVNGAPALSGQQLQNGDIVAFERERVGLGSTLNMPPMAAARDMGVVRSTGGVGDVAPPSDPRERARRYLQERAQPIAGWCACSECLPLPGEPLIGAVPLPGASRSGRVGTLHRASVEPCGTLAVHQVDGVWSSSIRGMGGGASGGGGGDATGGVVDALAEDRQSCATLRRQLGREGQERFDAVASGSGRDTAGVLQQAMAKLCAETGATGVGCTIVVCCRDRKGMLLDVSTAVTHAASNIINVHSEIFVPGAESAFQYKVTLHSIEQLERLVAAVRTVPDVTRVVRGTLREMMDAQREEERIALWEQLQRER